MFGCVLGQIRIRDAYFLSLELVEGTSLITGLKCNKGPSEITFEPKRNKVFICHDWADNMRHVHNSLNMGNLQSWHHGSCDQTELEKKETGFKKEFVAPEQMNMSFPFADIKCQVKQFETQWTDLLLFFPLRRLVIFNI